jgi:hypothetical protein
MVVLAHLRRRWCLSSREGFGFLSPSCRACEVGFRRFCGNEMPIFHYAESEKRWRKSGVFFTKKQWPDAVVEVTGRGKRVRAVQTAGRRARARGSRTDVSGPSRNRRIRSCTQKTVRVSVLSGHGGASGHVRPDAFDHAGSSLDSDRTPGATRPVTVGAYWTLTGRQVQRVRSNARARPVMARVTSDSHCSRLSCSDRTRPVSTFCTASSGNG